MKSPVPIEQLEEIIENIHASGDCEDSSAAVLPLEGDTLLYVPLKISAKIKRSCMTDTGACASAIPESLYREFFFNDNRKTTHQILNLQLCTNGIWKVIASDW